MSHCVNTTIDTCIRRFIRGRRAIGHGAAVKSIQKNASANLLLRPLHHPARFLMLSCLLNKCYIMQTWSKSAVRNRLTNEHVDCTMCFMYACYAVYGISLRTSLPPPPPPPPPQSAFLSACYFTYSQTIKTY